ncbi:hypothetical protein [Acinetobacter sp.]|jgi:hypothetical protein|uniref:hypothetical protein n=1 Tax=Acinetobacter sp. TaxID=472 RepID=UPI002825C79B|nr:hypothetical protein [Acinetobacter sp.]MDR0235598.1 hypothetical protein [Acinetobacter sp.]
MIEIRLVQAFPQELFDDVMLVAQYLENQKIQLHDTTQCEVIIHQSLIKIPARIYINAVQSFEFQNFPLIQRQILWCIFTRHHNGFVRQKALEKLLQQNLEYFMTPFIFQLLGEYVAEILKIIEPHLNENNQNKWSDFILENPQYFQITQSRIISYWNEYYRSSYPDFKNYIGHQILTKLKKYEESRFK